MPLTKPPMGLFLGAGASYEAGMPLVWELTTEIKNWLTPEKLRVLNKGWRLQGQGYSDAVIEDVIGFITRRDVHYESILGYLEVQMKRPSILRREYYGLYQWLVELVYHLIYQRQINNDSLFDKSLRLYDGIRALVDASAPLWVFSLNHDVIIEAIAARLAIPLYSGFSASTVVLPRRDPSGRKIGEISAEILTKADLENHVMHYPNPSQPGIYLMKIHGALDVFTFNDGLDLLKILPDGPGQGGVVGALRAANEDLLYPLPGAPGGKAKALNEIAYADAEGTMQFLRRSLLAGAFKFDPKTQQVLPMVMLEHFRRNLNFVSTLVCIGYSFGDNHINAAMREWLERSPDRRLEIVDPVARGIPSFLQHLSPQVEITNSTATDYLDSRASISRSWREKLEKRVAAALRSLSKERAREMLTSFTKREQDRISESFVAKLEALPLVDGEPDFSSLGDPLEVAKQWAAEMKLSEEEFLERLLGHIEASLGN